MCVQDVHVTCKQPPARPRTRSVLEAGGPARRKSIPCGRASPGSAGKGNGDGLTGG